MNREDLPRRHPGSGTFRVLIVTIVVFASLFGMLVIMGLHRHSISVLVLSLVVSVATGGLLAGVWGGIVSFVRPSGWRNILCVALLACVGCPAGAVSFSIMDFQPYGDWSRLPDPGKRPVQFLPDPTVPFSLLYRLPVRMSDGDLWSMTIVYADSIRWKDEPDTASSLPESMEMNRQPDAAGFPTPPDPGRVLDRFSGSFENVDARSQTNLVLLEDGSLWGWSRMVSGNYGGASVASLAGLLAGLVGGLAGWRSDQ